jgi:translation initiation factor 2B subunit (eIF-2B alpha/beta/delta family)
VIAISVNDTWNFMPKVTKVILAADYVFADGSLLATAGAKGVVMAAKNHYKTVCVIAGTHTFCPMTSFDNEDLVEIGAPVSVDYSQGRGLALLLCVCTRLIYFVFDQEPSSNMPVSRIHSPILFRRGQ